MVVQEDDDAPLEAPSSKQSKKYIVVKNHVRELIPDKEGLDQESSDTKSVKKLNTVEKKSLKRKNSVQKLLSTVTEPNNISESDLEELRTVYGKCKAVLQKIESKYGHLLCSEDNISNISNNIDDSDSDSCSCPQKKKIVFDENGQQIEKDCQLEKHICIKRIKRGHSDPQSSPPPKPSIKVEYDNLYTTLPNDLKELAKILRDVNIDKSYRRMVIDKFFLLKQEYLSEVRYEKENIIKQVKENPDEVFDFKGTNLSSLQGYPMKPEEKM